MLSNFDNPLSGDFQSRQVLDNYNQDPMHKWRGTLARVRRRAMLSKDPRQIMGFLQLAGTLGVDPSFSAVGRVDDRKARAENKLQQDTMLAQMFDPMRWLMPQPSPLAGYASEIPISNRPAVRPGAVPGTVLLNQR